MAIRVLCLNPALLVSLVKPLLVIGSLLLLYGGALVNIDYNYERDVRRRARYKGVLKFDVE